MKKLMAEANISVLQFQDSVMGILVIWHLTLVDLHSSIALNVKGRCMDCYVAKRIAFMASL